MWCKMDVFIYSGFTGYDPIFYSIVHNKCFYLCSVSILRLCTIDPPLPLSLTQDGEGVGGRGGAAAPPSDQRVGHGARDALVVMLG